MSKAILLNTGWTFTKEGHDEPVTLPHTWNAVDGQDGGNDYYRGTCSYTRNLEKPELSDGDRAVLQFDGVAMTAVVSLNGEKVAEHKGGYSTFRVDITDALHDGANELIVSVDNSDNDTVYPQKADFTFYGGIYRDISLMVVSKNHFTLDYFGGPGIRIDTHVFSGYTVPPYYDSMIGKIIAHGDTREQAIARMRVALSELAVEGIKTNTKLHRELLADERFFQGGTSIHYLEEKLRSRAEAHK